MCNFLMKIFSVDQAELQMHDVKNVVVHNLSVCHLMTSLFSKMSLLTGVKFMRNYLNDNMNLYV